MKHAISRHALAPSVLAISLAISSALLVSCGGDSSGSSGDATPKSIISGTAAFGAPLAGAVVTVLDASGATQTATAAADGSYRVDVTGMQAPFLVSAMAQSGDETRSYSALLTEAPAKGTVSTVNVTPLTTAIVALASSTGDDPAQFAAANALKNLDLDKVKAAETTIKTVIAEVAKDVGLPGNYDPVKTAFTATLGSAGDKILETVKVTVVKDTGVTLTNALVPIASDATAATATVTIKDTTAAVTSLPKPVIQPTFNDVLASIQSQFNACLALTPTDRVSVDGNGIPTALKGACANMSAIASDYKSNGYDFIGRWGARLLDMPQGAKVGQAEILATFARNGGGSTLSFRLPVSVLDKDGKVVGGLSYGDTLRSVDGVVWTYSGNQRKYDMGMSARMYKMLDQSTYPRLASSNGPDKGKIAGYMSRYESAFNFSFNPTGPNAANVYAVRIKGPGLPDAGLVLARSSVCGAGNNLMIYSSDGTLPDAAGKTAVFAATESTTATWRYAAKPIGDGYKGTDFWNELRGWDAPTVNGTTTTYNPASAGPAGAGDTPKSYPKEQVAATSIPEMPKFTWEIYSIDSSTPETSTMTLLDKPISFAAAESFAWATPSADSLKYLDPSAANLLAQKMDKATLGWTIPAGAPLVTWAGMSGKSRDDQYQYIRYTTGENVRPIGSSALVVATTQETDGLGKACANTTIPAHVVTGGDRNIQFNQSGNRIVMGSQYFHNGNTPPAPVKPAGDKIAWNVFNADLHPAQSASVVLSDGKQAQFSLGSGSGYINAATVSGGVLSLDTSVAAQSNPVFSRYGFSHAADEGFPKVATLLARIGGNATTTQRVMDLQAYLADTSAGAFYLPITIMNNESANAGGSVRVNATKTGTTKASNYSSTTFDTSVSHVYQLVMTVTDASGAGTVKVYLDGGSTPILDLDVAKFNSSTSTTSQIRFGQLNSTVTSGGVTTNLAYKSTMHWLLWAPGAYTPAEVKSKLPAGIELTGATY